MMYVAEELWARNPSLTIFGVLCVLGTIVCGILTQVSQIEILGINGYMKPLKFFLSIGIFSLTMAWFMGYLPEQGQVSVYSWMVILVMSFELIYITIQASRGETSHFNNSSAFHSTMWALMGITISILTLWTAYIGLLFFKHDFPQLPASYVWGIRLGILIFVLFAFEGAMMGSRLAHTVGGPDGEVGIKFLNWSVKYGDLRVAHFFGMHALQVLPLVGFYVFSQPKYVIILSLIYFVLVMGLLVQALMGHPVIRTS